MKSIKKIYLIIIIVWNCYFEIFNIVIFLCLKTQLCQSVYFVLDGRYATYSRYDLVLKIFLLKFFLFALNGKYI